MLLYARLKLVEYVWPCWPTNVVALESALVKDHLEPGAFMMHFPDWNNAQFSRFQVRC